MYRPRAVLTKVISRYLNAREYKAFIKELSAFEEVSDPLFVEIMNKHFDIERWRTSPIVKQDLWLYNYFVFEYKQRLKCTKLFRKYINYAFIYDDAEFFSQVEAINEQPPKLPKGVTFIPNEGPEAQPANHKLSGNLAPGSNKL